MVSTTLLISLLISNITLRDLNGEQRIYQRSALRKVNQMSNVCLSVSIVAAFWKVISAEGLPH